MRFEMAARSSNTKVIDLKISEDLFIIPDEEKYILYDPNGPSVLCVNKAAVQALQCFKRGDRNRLDPNSSFVKKLIAAGILFRGKKGNQKTRFQNDQADFDPEGVSLFLTTRCSMRCIYCYSNGGDNPKLMKWSTAKAAIDWIVDHINARGKRSFYVSFHGGGEVTTSASLMKRCVEYVRQQTEARGITARIEAGLNGVMNRQTVDWVTQNIDGATVSLDGPPEVQNFQRPLASGGDSFSVVSAMLQYMDGKEFRYSIRTTVTQDCLEKLADSVEFIAKNFGARSIQVEPVYLVGRAIKNKMAPIDTTMFMEQYRKAAQRARNHGKELKYSGARFHITTNSFCKAATGNSFAVTPDGLITSCYEVAEPDDPRSSLFIFGSLDQRSGQFVFDKEKIQKLRSLTVENKPFCEKCFCKWHCAGDCPAKLAFLGDAWDPSSNPRCYINRELTKDQIRECLLQKADI
jgi:uncharacterized protein